jgi:hypothetical protein
MGDSDKLNIDNIISRLLEGKLPSLVERDGDASGFLLFAPFALPGTLPRTMVTDLLFCFQQCVVLDPARMCSYPKVKSEVCV